MSAKSGIPLEITNQCMSGGSLLIQGGPGSGKTIMALSLLRDLKELGLKVTFISVRLPVGTLLRTTTLSKDLCGESIIDASMQKNLEEEPEVPRMPLADLSDLAMIYLKTADPGGVVVLDSWDALLQRDKRLEKEVYTATVDLINRTPGSLVFITENTIGVNPLDHVVDAHVRLQTEMFDGNVIRLLQIDKLRGQPIETPTYVFSLSDGVFKAYDPKAWILRENPIRATGLHEPIPETDGYYSTGMTRLDGILGGGYKKGSYVGIEIDLEAPAEACDLTYLPTVADFLSKARPVLALLPGARDANSLWDTARNIFDEQAWKYMKTNLIDQLVRVLSFGSRDDDESTVDVGSDIENDLAIWKKTRKELRYKSGQPILEVVGYDTLCRVYGRERVEPIIGNNLPETRYRGDLIIAMVTNDLAIKDSILGISDYYFRLKPYRGVPIFSGVRPRIPVHTISLVNDGGVPKANLERIS